MWMFFLDIVLKMLYSICEVVYAYLYLALCEKKPLRVLASFVLSLPQANSQNENLFSVEAGEAKRGNNRK